MACHSAVIPLCICVSVSVRLCKQETESIVSALCVCFVVFSRFVCIVVGHLYLTLVSSCCLFFFLSSPGRILRAKRTVEAANPKEYEYVEGSIPIEWDGKSGLQHRCYIFELSLTWINGNVYKRAIQQSL